MEILKKAHSCLIEALQALREFFNGIMEYAFPPFLILFFGGLYTNDLSFLISWVPNEYILELQSIFISLVAFYLAYLTNLSEENFKKVIKHYVLFLSILSLSIISFFEIFSSNPLEIFDAIVLFYFLLALVSGFCLFLYTVVYFKWLAKVTAFLLWLTFLIYLVTTVSFWCLTSAARDGERGYYCTAVLESIEKEKTKTTQI